MTEGGGELYEGLEEIHDHGAGPLVLISDPGDHLLAVSLPDPVRAPVDRVLSDHAGADAGVHGKTGVLRTTTGRCRR